MQHNVMKVSGAGFYEFNGQRGVCCQRHAQIGTPNDFLVFGLLFSLFFPRFGLSCLLPLLLCRWTGKKREERHGQVCTGVCLQVDSTPFPFRTRLNRREFVSRNPKKKMRKRRFVSSRAAEQQKKRNQNEEI